MKRFIPILMMLLLLTGCGAQSSETTYRQISMEEAVTMMEEETEYIILDVRTAEEYCRSGNRSKQASEKLVKLGYTNIVEIGGINSWPGETVAGDK